MPCNKTVGNGFERELAKELSENGFWVHIFAQNREGQPCDIIAMKDNSAILIDCKTCASDTFRFSRAEENQRNAMSLWKEKGGTDCYFVIRFDKYNEIYVLGYDTLLRLESEGFNSIKCEDFNDDEDIGAFINLWI